MSWQAIYDTLFVWVDILGNSWLEDASKSIANAINNLIDDQASGLLQSILDGVLKDISFGQVDCSIYDGYVTPQPPSPPPRPPPPPPKPRTPPKKCVCDCVLGC
jgi:hypothetical protein